MNFNSFTLIQHFLEFSAEKFPENIAVIHGNNRINFALLDKHVNSMANFLIKNNIEKRDRVGLLFKNSIEYIIAYFAILKAGGIAVPLNSEYSIKSLTYIINDCSIKGLICQKTNYKIIKNIASDIPNTKWILFDEIIENYKIPKVLNTINMKDILESESDGHPERRSIDCDITSIFYTSGSTGKPKGVTLSHLNWVTNTKSIMTYLKLTHNDRVLVILPFHYCYGKSLLHTHFMVGGSVVLENRFAYPNVVLDTMKKEKVTGFSGVPSTFYILLSHSTFAKQKFPHLRYITQAGGAMAPSTIKKLIDIFPDKKIFIMYGATEASARLSYLDPNVLDKKIGSIGKAIPNVELSIVKDNGKEADILETGEIIARGTNIMSGYWNDPQETNRVLKKNGYHTGDLAKMDKDGYIYIIGRKKDMVKVGGNRFSTKEVEEILIQHPRIVEIAVIGIQDSILGETTTAFIVTKPDIHIDEQDIRLFCSGKMPQYMWPKNYIFISKLPKNSAGKVMKEILRENIQQPKEKSVFESKRIA